MGLSRPDEFNGLWKVGAWGTLSKYTTQLCHWYGQCSTPKQNPKTRTAFKISDKVHRADEAFKVKANQFSDVRSEPYRVGISKSNDKLHSRLLFGNENPNRNGDCWGLESALETCKEDWWWLGEGKCKRQTYYPSWQVKQYKWKWVRLRSEVK